MTSDSRIVRITSPELRLRPLEPSPALCTSIDEWEVAERFRERRYWYNNDPYGSYHLELTRVVPPDEDPGNVYIEGCYLAQRLDQVWVYSTGLRLGVRGFDLFLSPIQPPPDWSSNGAEVIPEDDWSLLSSRISSGPTHRTTPHLPLAASLEALRAFDMADEVTDKLSSFHLAALTTTEADVHFLLLAQGLEIARELLPGASAQEKHQTLPEGLRTRLHHDINWLFGIANQRRQTRHSIDKRSGVTLKPSLSDEEEAVFVHDANLLLQYVVSVRLNIPFVVNHKGHSQTVGR